MRYADEDTPVHRFPDHIQELLHAMLQNRRTFSENDTNPPKVTDAIRYQSEVQKRLQPLDSTPSDERSQRISELFPFDRPIGYQHEVWCSIGDMLHESTSDPSAALVTAPTGFGKTEAFLGPLLDALATEDIENIALVYPRTALLRDQLTRVLRSVHHLNNTRDASLSVGPWYGDIPFEAWKVSNDYRLVDKYTDELRIANCWCGGDDIRPSFIMEPGENNQYTVHCENAGHSFDSDELVMAKAKMKNNPPNILMTTLQSLELSSLKPNYDILEELDAVVIDEIHLYQGIYGSHAAQVFRNVRRLKEEEFGETPLFIGSSATLASPKRFASKMFGVDQEEVKTFSPDPERDYKPSEEVSGRENHYFLLSSSDVSLASTFTQQGMLLGHTQLQPEGTGSDERKKILSFIDSVSSVNQKYIQFVDADSNRELWRYHLGYNEEDWEAVANRSGHEFIDEKLRVDSDHSDKELTARDIAYSDILISTSSLEVGIDIQDIEIITQYHAPYDLSSFVQRAGRAGRNEGDSHIVTFLSQNEGDKNLFNRADRFVDDNVTTPLNPDNRVVRWVHESLYAYYLIACRVREEGRPEQHFLRAFLCGPNETDLSLDESVDYEWFYEFLTSPESYLDPFISENVTNLIDQGKVQATITRLEEEREEMQESIKPIADALNSDVGDIANASNPERALVSQVRDSGLQAVDHYISRISELEQFYQPSSKTIETLHELGRLRCELQSLDSEESSEPFDQRCRSLFSDLRRIDQTTVDLPYSLAEDSVELSYGFGSDQLEQFQTVTNRLSKDPIEQLRDFRDEWQATYYLRECLGQLSEYHDVPGKSWQSAYAVKHLLRSVYFFDRYLDKRADAFVQRDLAPSREIFYIPEQYFDASGSTFTLVEHTSNREEDDQRRLTEESLFELFSKYYPLRTHFTQSGQLQLFQPPIRETTTGLEIDFAADRSQVEATREADFLEPDAIPLKLVEDCSGSSGQMILNYCPRCYEVMRRYSDECPRHEDSQRGKLYSEPEVEGTILEDSTDLEPVSGGLSIGQFTMELKLVGVDIEEYRYGYNGDTFFRLNSDPNERYISIPKGQEIGFQADTKGFVWEFDSERTSNWVGDVLDELNAFRRGKSLSVSDAEEIRRHTAAHLLMLVTADVAGVKIDTLRYHVDDSNGRIIVYEQAEGGQGIVDLACDELQGNPAKFLDSLLRVSLDPTIIGLQCWATTEFTDQLQEAVEERPLVDISNEIIREAVRDTLVNYPDTSFFDGEFEFFTDAIYEKSGANPPGYVENIEQEVTSYIDKLDSIRTKAEDTLGGTINDKELVAAGHEFAKVSLKSQPPSAALSQTALSNLGKSVVDDLLEEACPDGCVNTLHVQNCTGSHQQDEQSDCLSHVLLQTLRKQLVAKSSHDSLKEHIDNTNTIPAMYTDSENPLFVSFE